MLETQAERIPVKEAARGKAVALLSGGLDSSLAVKLIIEQGIEVYALNFTSAFCTCTPGKGMMPSGKGKESGCKSSARIIAEKFGIPIKTLVKGLDYMEIVRNPRHGYGKGINPCVDCRIYMFERAKQYMEEVGASFIITGEVLGQRPMSQRRDSFETIERETGLKGLILRPLCAQHLSPTVPETAGTVDRAKLLDMSGRTRKPQISLAEQLEIEDYPCPSGGCLLTDKIFSKKVRDLLDHKKEITITDLHSLKTGRHFRYNGSKIIISKNEEENPKLKTLAHEGDTILEPEGFPGPSALICGKASPETIEFAGRLILRYASKAGGKGEIKVSRGQNTYVFIAATPPDDKTIEGIRVC